MTELVLHEGDRVITPSDRVGIVKKSGADGFVQGVYLSALCRQDAEFTLAEAYLVPWPPDAPRPAPRRFGAGRPLRFLSDELQPVFVPARGPRP